MEDTIDKILEAPGKLEEITGLSKKNRLAFVDKLRQITERSVFS